MWIDGFGSRLIAFRPTIHFFYMVHRASTIQDGPSPLNLINIMQPRFNNLQQICSSSSKYYITVIKKNLRPAVRAKSKTIEAIQVNLVEDEPLYEYNIYLLPMGRRLKGKIPDKPQNIDTQYKEYKVNLDGKVSLMNCKVWVIFGPIHFRRFI